MRTMWEFLGSLVDVVHALLMAVWVLGLPFLFVRRWPAITRAYGIYAISFVFISQISHFILGECFLTTIASRFWQRSAASAAIDSDEWFTVRLAKWVFDKSPSHRAIVILSEVLIFATAFGELIALRLARRFKVGALAPRARHEGSDRFVSHRDCALEPRADGQDLGCSNETLASGTARPSESRHL